MKQKSFGFTRVVLGILILMMTWMSGCEKKADVVEPNPTEQTTTEKKTVDQNAAEKEFISASDVSFCELEETTISRLGMASPPSFVRRMERAKRDNLKQGTITLSGRKYKVLLGDDPKQEFHVLDIEKNTAPYWWGAWSVHSKHMLDGKFYEFMLIENGDKLAGRPYTGEFGTFKLGKGGRTLEKMEMSGSIKQAGYIAAPVGTISKRSPEPVAECSLPVGDYTPDIMSVSYDDLRISMSHNYYNNADGKRSMDNIVYGIGIRKDQPYVLDFSNKPMIIFESPKKGGASFSLGDEIKFSAVLIDPKLDIMIRGLDDTSVKIEKEYKDNDGNVVHTAKIAKSLDPTVVIARSDGEIVGEGIMPFG
ncbi:MAG: hypothetical protein KAS23_15550 [Anaerohalosphaera sp.]|nr:hypothetical protein [Anaerohalosphaera sp.]